MKIKLAILDKDQNYINRVVSVFSTKYADKFEIYSFTDMKIALGALDGSRVDVFLASDAFEIDVEVIPARCSFAYFVDSPDIETVNGQCAICKFQKVDLIYKQILSIYSEKAGSVSGLKLGDDSTKVIIFSSPNGGAGTSTVAAACAMNFAMQGKKSLYINLEKVGTTDPFFMAEGQFDMSDIIYAIKSKKANLAMKLESCVKQDNCGVSFYSQSKVALDMLEMNEEDSIRLISELKLAGSYDYIIVDMDFGLDKESIKVYKQAHAVVWVGDGTGGSNSKIQRAFGALSVMEQNADAPLTSRLCLIYNKFSNKVGQTIDDIGIRSIGGAPLYMHATERQIMEQLAQMNFYNNII